MCKIGIMLGTAGENLPSAILFMNSNKSEKNIRKKVAKTREKCLSHGIILGHDVVICKGPDRDVDRDAVNLLISFLMTGQYDMVAVDKLTAAFRAAAALPGAAIAPMPDNTVVRVQVSALTPDIDEHRCAGGFFVEYAAETLDGLIPVVKRKYQTLSYLGLEPEALRRFVRENALWGVDRIAPVGHTMDFALTWDGYDLIRTLSRRISAI